MARRRDIEWKHCFLLSRFGPHSLEAEEAEIALRRGLTDDATLLALERIYATGSSYSSTRSLPITTDSTAKG